MALVQCPECKKEVSSYATNCPVCGFPLQSTNLHNGSKRRAHAKFLASIIGFGSHNFYLGFYAKGIIQLFLSFIGLILFIIGLVSVRFWLDLTGQWIILGVGLATTAGVIIWQLIEWNKIKTQSINHDAKGQPLI